MIKIHGYQCTACHLVKTDMLSSLAEHVVSRNLDSDHVIGLYFTEKTKIASETAKNVLEALVRGETYPCYVISTPNISTVDEFISMVSRLHNMRAFL